MRYLEIDKELIAVIERGARRMAEMKHQDAEDEEEKDGGSDYKSDGREA